MTRKTTVMIVDDHPMVREGLSGLLAAAGFEVAASLESGDQAIAAFRRKLRPDVVLMDIRMPGGKDGFETLKELRAWEPEANVVLMAGMPLRAEVDRARALKARGYLPKTMKPRDLVAALRRIVDDRRAFVEEEAPAPESPLSPREMDVLKYLAEGKSREETAIILGLSHETVKTHAKSIHFKLGTTNTAQAVAEAYKRGVLRV